MPSTVPDVSVVLPAWNRCDLLARSVESAKAQTGVTVEILVVDDGSTDNTRERWEQAEGIRYLRQPHSGACAARNLGIDHARGNYIAFLDSDDTWQPDKLRRQIDTLMQHHADAVVCAFNRWTDDTRYTQVPGPDTKPGQLRFETLLQENTVSTQTVLVRRDCLNNIRFDPRFPRMQDWDFALQLVQKCHVYYSGEVLADVYLQQDSISNKPELAMKAMRLMAEKYRAAYLHSLPCTRSLMTAFYTFGCAANESFLRDCLRLLHISRPLKENAYILARTCKMALQPKHRNRR